METALGTTGKKGGQMIRNNQEETRRNSKGDAGDKAGIDAEGDENDKEAKTTDENTGEPTRMTPKTTLGMTLRITLGMTLVQQKGHERRGC